MSYYLILYFIAGVVQDFFFTLNMKFTAREKALPAGIFAFLEIIITFLVLYNILTNLDKERSVMAIIIYALGIGIGSFLGVKFKTK